MTDSYVNKKSNYRWQPAQAPYGWSENNETSVT